MDFAIIFSGSTPKQSSPFEVKQLGSELHSSGSPRRSRVAAAHELGRAGKGRDAELGVDHRGWAEDGVKMDGL